ncbi:MAG: adenylyltransferase/cytidyltransferase family protein [Candidatus Hodarchaeota archaeon]
MKLQNKKYSLFIGRYQPLHKGHIALIRTVLNEGKNVLIALRNTGINEKNPHSYDERVTMFIKEFQKELDAGRMKIIQIDDIEEVCYGRKVGWGIRQIRLNKKIEDISATKIRESNKK